MASAEDELKHIAEKLEKDLELVKNPSVRFAAMLQALRSAFEVGHKTTTTDDWVHLWD